MHERWAVVASSKAFGAFAHVTVSERAAPYQARQEQQRAPHLYRHRDYIEVALRS
jgi:hypothetical protein